MDRNRCVWKTSAVSGKKNSQTSLSSFMLVLSNFEDFHLTPFFRVFFALVFS